MNPKNLETVRDVVERVKEGYGVVFVGVENINANEMNDLRNKLRSYKTGLKVVKNTLAERAVEELNLPNLKDFIDGQTGIMFLRDSIIEPLKFSFKFLKENQKFKIKGGYIFGKIYGYDELKWISELPSKGVLIANFVGMLKALYMRLLYSLGWNTSKLLLCLDLIRKAKG